MTIISVKLDNRTVFRFVSYHADRVIGTMFSSGYRETGVVDDGCTVVDAQQVTRHIQQPGLEAIQVQHEFWPRKYTAL